MYRCAPGWCSSCAVCKDAFDHDKGQKSAISGCRLRRIFSNFLQWIFPFSQGLLCNLARKSPQNSGTEKEPKPKLLSPDIFRWGRGLPREGVGAKKFGMSLETREIKLLGGISRDFAAISWRRPKSLRKNVCVQFLAPKMWRKMSDFRAEKKV